AEEVPDVEILRRVDADELALEDLADRQPLVEPDPQALPAGCVSPRQAGRGSGRGLHAHQATPFSSAPLTSLRPFGYGYGGTTRSVAAWAPENTRPARPQREPRPGHKT